MSAMQDDASVVNGSLTPFQRIAELERQVAVLWAAHEVRERQKVAGKLKGSRVFFNAERDALLLKMRGDCRTTQQIAKALGCGEGTVSKRIRELGLPKLLRGNPMLNWMQSEIDELCRLRAKGFYAREIAEMMGKSTNSVKYKIGDLRLPCTPRKRANGLPSAGQTPQAPIRLPVADAPVSMVTRVRDS